MTRFILVLGIAVISCSSSSNEKIATKKEDKVIVSNPIPPRVYSLSSYLSQDSLLNIKVDSVFNTMTDHDKIAQLIMPAVGRMGQTEATIKSLIEKKLIGGVLMLNGSKEQFKKWIDDFETKNKELGSLPFLYSADAEPSLVNRKITGTKTVKKAAQINSIEEVITTANSISSELNDIGINYNFAPVVDMSSNSTVGYRGFGEDPKNIIPFSNAFISVMQNKDIIGTAKHFPGHGLVSGDTHKSLQQIDGKLRELKYYPPLIKDSVLSIMIAHIAVKNNPEFNTDGMPATTSKKIVSDLLRDSLGFKGLIVTDAMNMGGVAKVKNASVLATAAGCDILLMPLDASKSHAAMLKEYKESTDYKETVNQSVRRIIRMKICLGLIR